MKHQLDPGSYELWQEGVVRGHGYIEETAPDTTLQRWLLLADYVFAPKLQTTFKKAERGFSNLEEWERFVRESFAPGCKYGRATAQRYASISVTPKPNHQLDGNSRVFNVANQEVAQVYVKQIPALTTQMVEHWVLHGDFEPSAASGLVVRNSEVGYASLDMFQTLWQRKWADNMTYVVVSCSYFDELPPTL